MESLWRETVKLPAFDRLERDINTEALVIGGGMAGVLCAYFLKKKGVECVLVEADRLCGGITGNTTAKITSQHGLIYDRLIREFGIDRARAYLRANQAAVKRLGELCRGIDCDFEEKDSYVYSLDDRRKLDRELKALARIGFPARLERELPLPFPVAGAVKFPAQAQFHPLKFVNGLLEGLAVYEHTPVRGLAGGTAVTDRARIRAKNIIVCTHFPVLNKHGSYFLKMYQHRSYVLALENAPQVEGMYVDQAAKGMSFRNFGELLLIGGGDHRTGKSGGNFEELERFAERHYPGARIKYRWAAQDCMTLDGVPYIGRYSARTEGLYVATGFNKWGMTSSAVAAELLSDMLSGKENPCAEVFSPSRTLLRPQLAANALEAAVNLLTPTSPRCPHLGCALKWNAAERSWDCPCHGSRFTPEGRLIDNPASGDLKRRP